MNLLQEWKNQSVAPILIEHGFKMSGYEFILKTNNISRIIAILPHRFDPGFFTFSYGVHRLSIPSFSTLQTVERPKLNNCQITDYPRDSNGNEVWYETKKWIPKRQGELESILLKAIKLTEHWSDPKQIIRMIDNNDSSLPYGSIYKKALLVYLLLEDADYPKACSIASEVDIKELDTHTERVWAMTLQAIPKLQQLD